MVFNAVLGANTNKNDHFQVMLFSRAEHDLESRIERPEQMSPTTQRHASTLDSDRPGF